MQTHACGKTSFKKVAVQKRDRMIVIAAVEEARFQCQDRRYLENCVRCDHPTAGYKHHRCVCSEN
jgi:hypothetical protein